MQIIKLGPAGLGSPAIKGVEFIHNKGLNFCEVAFTYHVYMSNEEAKKVGELAKKLNVDLSCHGEYWINLVSKDKNKREKSKKRILNAAEKAHYMKAKYVVFHAGFYQGRNEEEIYELVKNEIIDLNKEIKKNNWNVKLAPETTGKASQFGTLEELKRLAKETGCFFCIDPAHIYARNIGKIDYKEVLDKVKEYKTLHFHFSNLTFTKKGERAHMNMDHSPDFNELAKEILKRKINCSIVSESPCTWQDSLKMRKIFERLGYKF